MSNQSKTNLPDTNGNKQSKNKQSSPLELEMNSCPNFNSNYETTLLIVMNKNIENFILDIGTTENMINNPIGIYNCQQLPANKSKAAIRYGEHLEIVGNGY